MTTNSTKPDSRDVARIPLSTIGSRGVTLEVTPSALPEASGGVTLWSHSYGKEVAYTLTGDEARRLAAGILEELAT